MEVVRRRLQQRGFSRETVELLLASNGATTTTAYQTAWNDWSGWCAERDFDPLRSDVATSLSFLSHVHLRGTSYSFLNICRSMLSSTLDPIDGLPLGCHPLIKRLLKGCYNLRTPLPKYRSTWDPDQVLQFMSSHDDDKYLAHKLATLLALATLCRVGELASIDRASIEFTPIGVSFCLTKPRKNQTTGANGVFNLTRHSNKSVCPVETMGLYICSTDNKRSEHNTVHLFIAHTRPYSPASGSSIGRWIKKIFDYGGNQLRYIRSTLDPWRSSVESGKTGHTAKLHSESGPVVQQSDV